MKKLIFYILFIISLESIAQVSINDTNFRYADFHAHTTLKNFYRFVSTSKDSILRNDEDSKNANRQSRDRILTKTNNLITAPASAIEGKINNSYNQTTFDLLQKGNGSFIYTSLYALEKQSISEKKVKLKMPLLSTISLYLLTPIELAITPFTFLSKKYKVARNTFWNYWACRKIKLSNINHLAVTKLSISKQAKILNENFSSDTMVNEEIRFLQLNTNDRIQIVKDSNALDSFVKLKNNEKNIPTLIFLTYEGGHNFYGRNNSNIDSITSYYCDEDNCKNEIFTNIRLAKDSNYRIFMIGLAHLFYNKLAGASRGLDVDRPKVFRDILNKSIWSSKFSEIDNKPEEGFYDTIIKRKNKSVTCDCSKDTTTLGGENPGFGYRIVDSILKKEKKFNKRTFIDMRHLDIIARRQLIDYIDTNYWKKKDTIPLVVSHAAYSGENYKIAKATGSCPNFDIYAEFKNYKKYLYKKIKRKCGSDNKQALGLGNKTEINNHIIEAGWFHTMSTNLYSEEIAAIYKSKGMIGITFEERALGTTAYNYKKNTKTKNKLKNYITSLNDDHITLKSDSLINAEPFVRNLFAMIQHSGLKLGDINTWKHICLGTDFDGMMNPIDICPTAKEIPNFYNFLCNNLDFYIDYFNINPIIKCNKCSKELMNMLFYKNLEDFTIKHF